MLRLLPHPLYLRSLVQKKALDEIVSALARIEASAPAAHVSVEIDSVRSVVQRKRGLFDDEYWRAIEDAVFRLAVSLEKEAMRSGSAEISAARALTRDTAEMSSG